MLERVATIEWKVVRVVSALASTLNVLWVVIFGSYVVRARIALGHWPLTFVDDPKGLGFIVHHALVAPSILFLLSPVLQATLHVVGGEHGERPPWFEKAVQLFNMTYGVGLILAFGFLGWYVD